MQNLQKQVGQIFKILVNTEERQIKCECQITNLAKCVDFVTQKLDDYEKDWREKDAKIATFQSEFKITYMKVEDLEEKMDRKERALQEKLHFNSWIKRRKEQKYRW